MYVLSNIPFEVDLDQMIIAMRLSDKQHLKEEFTDLASEAEGIAQPRVLYSRYVISDKGEKHIILGEERLESRILRINLDKNSSAFPALATCGEKLDGWVNAKTNLLHQFWAKAISDAALCSAVKAMESDIKNRFSIDTVSFMTPGSLSDWPLSQQSVLFRLFGQEADNINVKLTENYLMIPLSTISCLIFESESRFFSCQLCSRTDCQARRAEYSEQMLEKYQLDHQESLVDESVCKT